MFFSFNVFYFRRFFESTIFTNLCFVQVGIFLNLTLFPIDICYFSTFCPSQHFFSSMFFPSRRFFHLMFYILPNPLLALRLGKYWFRISLYVYDRNKPLAPILRQRRCSLIYDVYLTCIDGDV